MMTVERGLPAYITEIKAGEDRLGDADDLRIPADQTHRLGHLKAEQEQGMHVKGGQSRSEPTRSSILEAERAQRRVRLRAEAQELRNDPEDVAASRELAAGMDTVRAR
jgi:hypothetical protein